MQNILLIISVIVTLLSLALLVYKTSGSQKEGFDMTTYHYYPYLYAMTTNKDGKLYTDKGMTYMQRYEMCSENPELWPCKLMFQEGL